MQHLSGDAGLERMKSALSDTRSKYFEAKENGSPSGLQTTHIMSPSPPSSTLSPSSSSEKTSKPSRVVRSLFREDDITDHEGAVSSAPKPILGQQLGSSSQNLVTENVLIVNEFLHEQKQAFSDVFNVTGEDQNNVQVSAFPCI